MTFGDLDFAPTLDNLAVKLALCLAKLAGELLLASSRSLLSAVMSSLLFGVEVGFLRPGIIAGNGDSSFVISSCVSFIKENYLPYTYLKHN